MARRPVPLPASSFSAMANLMVGVAEEDQPQHGHRVFRRLQFGVRPKFIGRSPEPLFDFRVVIGHARRSLGAESSKPISLPTRRRIQQTAEMLVVMYLGKDFWRVARALWICVSLLATKLPLDGVSVEGANLASDSLTFHCGHRSIRQQSYFTISDGSKHGRFRRASRHVDCVRLPLQQPLWR